MSETSHGLDALRGLHLATGAFIDPSLFTAICIGLLLALCLVLAGQFFGAPMNLFAMRAMRRHMRRALAATRRAPPDKQLAEQAIVLRRLARTLGGNEKAALRGDAWLAALDHWFRTDYFSRGEGRCFGDDLYRAGMSHDPAVTLRRLEALAGRLRK